MQKKFGTSLDVKVLSEARHFCQKEHTSISRLLEQAIAEYLERRRQQHIEVSVIDATFGALKLPHDVLKSVLEEEIYETF